MTDWNSLPLCTVAVLIFTTACISYGQHIDENHPLYYRHRGTHYEGIYNKKIQFPIQPEVGDSDFIIVGFTVGKFFYERLEEEVIEVRVASKSYVIGRSSASDLAFKYRFDATLSDNSKILWPVKDVLLHLNYLSPRNVGAFGFKDGTYLPVRVNHSTFTNDSVPRIHLACRSNIRNIKYRILDSNGMLQNQTRWIEVKINGKEYARAGQMIVIPISEIIGTWVLEVQAVEREGSRRLVGNFRFFLPNG